MTKNERTKGKGLEGYFQLKKNGTTVKTEILAGLTTFLTMAYVLGTIPNILSATGMNTGAILTSMILLIIGASVAMGLVTNRPFALAPGLGSVAIVSGMVAHEGLTVEITGAIIVISGLLFILISYLGLRDKVVNAIPKSLKQSVSAGVGLFIAMLGARNAGIIVAQEGRNRLAFGDLTAPSVILCLIGFILILVLRQLRVPGYMIIAILITTVIGIPMGLTTIPDKWFSLPENPFTYFGKLDFVGALDVAYIPFLIALFVPDFFSTLGTALGVGGKAGFLDKDGNLPGIDRVFKVDATATVIGGLFVMPCMTTYLESSAGVEAGGKTGLTSISTSFFFALTLLFTPIALMIPGAATAPALIIIGVGMLSAMAKIDYDDYTEAFPAFMCVAFTVFANNIANGICVAIPTYVILKLANREYKDISPSMYVLCAVCFLYFASIIMK